MVNSAFFTDPDVLAEIEEFRKQITAVTERVVGYSLPHLQGSPRNNLVCRQRECNLGNLISDAALWYWISSYTPTEWNDLSIAVALGGGIRDSIDKGTK